jgi:hypothetical protein
VSTLLSRYEVAKRDEIGVGQLLWGSDFPHHEGTVPYVREVLRATLHDVAEAEVRVLTSGNAARVYDVDLDLLQGLADEIGPSVAEVATPLGPGEVPDDPNARLLFAGV